MKNRILLGVMLIMAMLTSVATSNYTIGNEKKEQDTLSGLKYYLRDSAEKKVYSDGLNTVYTFTIHDKEELSKYEDKDEGELVSRTVTCVIPNDISNTMNNEIY